MATHTLYGPGTDVTGHATADLTASRFVAVAGPRVQGNIAVGPATAGARVLGVIGHDTKAGELGHVVRGSRIVGVETSDAIVAGTAIASGADGTAVAAADTAIVVGHAVDTASLGIVYVALA